MVMCYGNLGKPTHGGLRGRERYREAGAVLLSLETGWRSGRLPRQLFP